MKKDEQIILIVDDDTGTCTLLEKLLNQNGYATSIAYNGQEALESLKKGLPDLIILDVEMPVMDGFVCLAHIKTSPQYSSIPVIMLTVAKERKDVEHGLELRADFYLPKPFAFDNLMSFISTALQDTSSTSSQSQSIKKNIFGIGTIEYKFVSSREELEQSCCLMYEEYEKRGLILAKHYKTPCRVSIYHAVPGAKTIVALKDGKVVGTTTIVPDSPLGLPMDQWYPKETDKLRKSGRKFFEIGYLTISSALFPRGLFSLFNFQKLAFMFGLFKFVFQYPLYEARYDDICIVTDPKFMVFKFIPFKEIGPLKYYGFDYSSIKKKPVVLKILDLHKVVEEMDKRIALKKLAHDNKIPAEVLRIKYRMTPEDLHYFFVKKSDIFKSLKPFEREYIMKCYGLSEEDFNKILEGKTT